MNLDGWVAVPYWKLPWWQRIVMRFQKNKWHTVLIHGEKFFQRTRASWFAEGHVMFVEMEPDKER